jgi:hypothetical protein
MITELNRRPLVRLDQLPESCAPLQQRGSPEILAVEMEKIEGKEHDAVWCLVNGRAERVEIGDAVLVLDDDLAVDQRCLAGKLGAGVDHAAIWSGPVPATSREGSDLALVDNDQGAVAVMLDLVNPALSGGWFRHERGDFRPDKAERGRR